jgi:plasmid stabilization system protein ParE
MEVSFHRLAERELNEAAAYYEGEKPGLGARFLREVDRCIDSLLKHPEAGAIVIEAVRRRLVRRFPYAILYSIKPEVVRILAIMNLKRRPFYWAGRS